VQHASQALFAREPYVFQRSIETGDCPLIHFLVRSVAAVNPDNSSLITISGRVGSGSTESLRPVRGKAFGMLRVEPVAERMADNFVLQYADVPCVGQSQQPLVTTYGFINRLHGARL